MLRTAFLALLLPIAAAAAKTCPQQYFVYKYQLEGENLQTCLKFLDPGSRVSIYNACKRDGATLPNPKTTAENDHFKGMEIGDIWLGCSGDPGANQCLLDVTSANGADAPENGTCVYADEAGLWHNADCFTDLAYGLCIYNPPGDFTGSCYNGYAQFGTACYKYVSAKNTFMDAEVSCQHEMAQLTDIASQEENDFVFDMVRVSGGSSAWIGLTLEPDQTAYSWTNWAPFLFKNFAVATPPKSAVLSFAMDFNGKWQAVNSSSTAFVTGYVCKHSLS